VVPVDGRPDRLIDRRALEAAIQQANPDTAIQIFEEYQAFQLSNYFGFGLSGETTSVRRISEILTNLASLTGQTPAVIYVISRADGLELFLVLPQGAAVQGQWQMPGNWGGVKIAAAQPVPLQLGQALQTPPMTGERPYVIRKFIPEAKATLVKQVAREFRREVSDPRKVGTTSYLTSAQKLYQWMVAPLLSDLKANQINTLVFSMDVGLRSLPLAALHDGQQFLVENYSLALIPNFSLTDTRYDRLKETQMLGMGISESTEGQFPLPAVAIEVPTLTQKIWSGQSALNQEMTIENLAALTQQQRFRIVHLATHGEFKPGRVDRSYIQFWNRKLKLNQLRSLALQSGWSNNPSVHMLVLSACQTALGDNNAELGFAGLAVNAGVKTALGSLWSVSDEGSLGLMSGFYEQLRTAPIKAEALRQAQLSMLRGQTRLVGGQLKLTEQLSIPLTGQVVQNQDASLAHPYYWSAFTMVGNWN
jgi:CHAT domain-containing protein